MPRAFGYAVAAVVLGVSVFALREATESRHVATHPDSRSIFVVDASTNRADERHSAREMAAAQLALCRLETPSDPVGPIEALDDDPTRFRVVLQPELDETDRRQFEGCVEDWLLDHVRLRVVSAERSGP
jgi:hypothetical protein